MIKKRIQEIFDFTKSESPYRKANKGWINKDIFLDLTPSPEIYEQRKEAAKITLLWSPINRLLSNIFLIFIIGSLLVFTSLSFAKGRFDFSLFSTATIKDSVKVEDNIVLKTSQKIDLDSINSEIEQKIDMSDIDKSNLLDENSINLDQEIISKKIHKKENVIKEIESNKVIKKIKNKKSKTNFI